MFGNPAITIARLKDLILIGVALAVIGIGIHLWREHGPAQVQVATPVPGVKVVTVDRPVITERVVKQVISDPKDQALIASLISQLNAAKADAKTVTVAQATSTSTGEGTVTVTPPTQTTPQTTHFQDYRLTFDSTGTSARYTLQQKFETMTTTGRRKDGSALALTKLYEIGPGDTRREIPVTTTTVIAADETVPHWLTHLAIQGGIAETRDSAGKTGTQGMIAAQWLKHGRTYAAEDTTYAILSPAIVLGSGVQDVGVLPVSVNLGRIPHQPLSNLWLSIVVTRNRVGPTISASF